MNYLRIPQSVVCYLLLIAKLHAQTAPDATHSLQSPAILVSSSPQKLPCRISALKKLFQSSGKVSFRPASGLLFRCKISAHVWQNETVESVTVKLPELSADAFGTFSRIKLPDGTFQYTGHILNLNQTEALALRQENGRYYFLKMEQRLIITD